MRSSSRSYRDLPTPVKVALLERLRQLNGKTQIRRAHTSLAYLAFQKRYRDDPEGFALDCIEWDEGRGPTFYQRAILGDLVAARRVCVRGPHGLGKTSLAAILVLWYALTRDGDDWKVVTTASAWRQLTNFLWPEIHKWAQRLRWTRIGRPPFGKLELLSETLKLATGEAFPVASNNAALIEGAHADCLLYVFDEAKAIPFKTWDAAEGAFSGSGASRIEALAFAISTPGEPQGRFYEIQTRRPGLEDWKAVHVTLADAIRAGRVSPDWAEQRKRQWGEDSAVYRNRVEGEFAAASEAGLIPLAWVEAANERWQEWVDAGRPGEHKTLGVDVGRGGDKTVIAPLLEWQIDDVWRSKVAPQEQKPVSRWVIAELIRDNTADTMVVTGKVVGFMRRWGCAAVVDVIGVGAGVYDRIREQGLPVTPFNASERSDDLDSSRTLGFANKRSAGWWALHELLKPANGHWVALPPDDTLTGDLTALHWKVTSGGHIHVESKDDVKRRLNRSTDDGDAVMMALYVRDTGLFAWDADAEEEDD